MHISSQVQHHVAMIDADHSALDAAKQMTDRYIGALVVTDASDIKGVFTERDLMRIIGEERDPAQVKVGDVINKSFVTVGPDEEVMRCLDLMKENRCRHLIVLDGETFVGIVSVRDMVALMLSEKEALIARLQEYISS